MRVGVEVGRMMGQDASYSAVRRLMASDELQRISFTKQSTKPPVASAPCTPVRRTRGRRRISPHAGLVVFDAIFRKEHPKLLLKRPLPVRFLLPVKLETAMEPARYGRDTKTGSLPRRARLTQRVNLVILRTSSFRVLARLSRTIQSRFQQWFRTANPNPLARRNNIRNCAAMRCRPAPPIES